jgi:hypothetical protein
MRVYFVLAFPTIPPTSGSTIDINSSGRTGSGDSNLGVIAGGTIVVTILFVGAVALIIFIIFM